ncbi:carbohydrate ABC transporter permease [Rhodopila sp.]|jgi:multiple sugar transport system permease protein|uniref:carbohydrate ABC transporter permease n=1 Tax=Rhodopila sp. TaxID=2480087 RepID=UPI002BA7FD5B|nr:sugar ABC transporter permease [Rhodopila sp.]HVZ07528.1 sugar ABC transporter permease [Rhodopila sp.]
MTGVPVIQARVIPTRARQARGRRGAALPYLLLAPALVLLAGMAYPFGLGVYYSFTSYWLQYPKRFRFIWFDNYIGLLDEPLFGRALLFTLGFTVVAVVVQVGLGLAVALFLHARIPGRNVIRALMLLPLMMPPVITALMWKIMMASTNAGILNYMLSFVGLGPVNWFGEPNSAIVSILIIDTWGNLPFVSLILLGALQALPTEPYEAALVDGAGPWGVLRYITLPLLGPFIVLAVMFRTMDSLRIFDVIYATTQGGPNDATTNLLIMAYQYSFQWYQMGKGMAQSIVLLILVVIVSYGLMRLWNRAAASTA